MQILMRSRKRHQKHESAESPKALARNNHPELPHRAAEPDLRLAADMETIEEWWKTKRHEFPVADIARFGHFPSHEHAR